MAQEGLQDYNIHDATGTSGRYSDADLSMHGNMYFASQTPQKSLNAKFQ